jgi:hypothetical protein
MAMQSDHPGPDPGPPVYRSTRDWHAGVRPGLGGSKYVLRIGDAERDAAADLLGEHFVAGRLTLDELNERLESVLRAKTQEDIAAVMDDLPTPRRPPPTPRRPAPADVGQQAGRYVMLAIVAFVLLLWVLSAAMMAQRGYGYYHVPTDVGNPLRP